MLTNIAEFDGRELISIFGENNLRNLPTDCQFKGISIDSRTIEHGNIFIALQGANIDGHAMISDALEKGAGVCVASKEWFESNSDHNKYPIILVEDTLKALGELAHFHRMRFDFPVIAIAGSNGKTTTKELTALLLSSKFNVLKTYKNFNNQLGVPLMLLQMTHEYTAAVLELATNEPGEIYVLSEMAAPTHGLITNIGKEHLEGFIDLIGVEMEETYLYGFLKKQNGFAFINNDDERLVQYTQILENGMLYGQNVELGLSAEIILNDQLQPKIDFAYQDKVFSAQMKAIGLSTALNAIAAAAVALNLDVPANEIKAALESFESLGGSGYARMTIEYFNGIKILNDCYNANPSSMKIALDTLRAYNCGSKKYAILGDMKELGDSSKAEHIEILEYASSIADHVLITGVEMRSAKASTELTNVQYFENKGNISFFILNDCTANDFILLKGSRGMKMEEILSLIK